MYILYSNIYALYKGNSHLAMLIAIFLSDK